MTTVRASEEDTVEILGVHVDTKKNALVIHLSRSWEDLSDALQTELLTHEGPRFARDGRYAQYLDDGYSYSFVCD